MEGVNESFICPIAMCLMVDPVVCLDGHTYSRSSITDWFETCKRKGQPLSSPKTGAILPADFLVPTQTIKTMVLEWIEEKKAEWALIEGGREQQQGKGSVKEEGGKKEGGKGQQGKGKGKGGQGKGKKK